MREREGEPNEASECSGDGLDTTDGNGGLGRGQLVKKNKGLGGLRRDV